MTLQTVEAQIKLRFVRMTVMNYVGSGWKAEPHQQGWESLIGFEGF